MKGLKRQIKTIRWMLKINLLGFDYGVLENQWNNFINKQTMLEKEQRMFKFISKHAEKRLQERMLYWGYTMEDIHNDILNSNIRYKRKEATKIIGKLGTYVISHAGNLITVI